MAYTPYNQALPDTTLYERLQGNYTPIRGRENPYDSSLFSSQDYLDNKEDPFGYAKKKLGFGPTLDDTLGNKAAAVGLGGLFAPQASSGGGDSGNQENQRNYYVEREAELRAANLPEEEVQAILSAEQEANNARLAAGLTLFSNALIPGMGIAGLSKYGPEGYRDYLQGNTRVMMGDTTGYTGTDPRMPVKEADAPAPIVSGAYVDAINQGLTPAQASNVAAGGGGYSGPGGVGGSGVSYGGGNAAAGYGYGGW